MKYSLLIVEDERKIREGLVNFVDWGSLGFYVAAKLQDGQDAIEYLESHDVDMVLTDIKMTFATGLDLAKYVSEHCPSTKVIIITGYKDFDFAREAIKYNVVDYLLKPINLDKINEVFTNLKMTLDKEMSAIDLSEKYNEVIPILREQFFLDMIVGALKDRKDINKKIELLDLNIDPNNSLCSIINIKFEESITSKQELGKEEIYLSISNYIQGKKDLIYYFPVRKINENIMVLAISDTYKDHDKFNELIMIYLKELSETIKDILSLEIKSINIKYNYDNLYELAFQKKYINFINNKTQNENREKLKQRESEFLLEQQKIFLSYLNAGNFAAVENLVDTLVYELMHLDLNYVKNFIIDLFALVSNKLKTMGIDIRCIIGPSFNYQKIFNMSDITEISSWSKAMFKQIIECTSDYKSSCQKILVRQAKKYIRDDYNNDISLEDVAEHVAISPVYLSRLFKEETGENFIDYLTEVRVDKSREFLRNPAYKIYQISEMVGYKSSKYFSRIFKQKTGYSPSEYRNHILEMSEDK